jgi:hypothetical protein
MESSPFPATEGDRGGGRERPRSVSEVVVVNDPEVSRNRFLRTARFEPERSRQLSQSVGKGRASRML